jgi:hypothetical protein
MARSIENRLAKLEEATALTPDELESEQRIRESEARVRVLDARLEVLTAQYFAEHGKLPPVHVSEVAPEGLADEERLAWGVGYIARLDARKAELIAIRDAPLT